MENTSNVKRNHNSDQVNVDAGTEITIVKIKRSPTDPHTFFREESENVPCSIDLFIDKKYRVSHTWVGSLIKKVPLAIVTIDHPCILFVQGGTKREFRKSSLSLALKLSYLFMLQRHLSDSVLHKCRVTTTEVTNPPCLPPINQLHLETAKKILRKAENTLTLRLSNIFNFKLKLGEERLYYFG